MARLRSSVPFVLLLVLGGLSAQIGIEKMSSVILSNDLQGLNELGSRDANFELEDARGYTPLMIACEKGNDAIVKQLLDYGVNRNVTGDDGMSPLVLLLRGKRWDLVKSLLQGLKRADPNFKNIDGDTPLILCVKFFWNEGVRLLLDAGARIKDEDTDGFNAFVYAVKYGNAEALRLFLDRKFPAEFDYGNHFSPILDAACTGNPEIVKMLIDAGAKVVAESTGGGESGGKDILNPLMLAVQNNRLENLKLFQAAGADLHYQSWPRKNTLLMIASQLGHLPIMRFLLSNGVDVNAVDSSGNTAVAFAIAGKQIEALKLLVKSGADLGLRNRWNKTAMYVANDAHWTDGYLFLDMADATNPLSARRAASLTNVTVSNGVTVTNVTPGRRRSVTFTPEFQGPSFGGSKTK